MLATKMMSISTEQLLTFFKVMADESRLKIVGLLAQQPRSVEELAALLGLGAPTVSHHLGKLRKAGLVQAQAQQYYNLYSLNHSALQTMGAVLSSAMKPETMMNAVKDTSDIDHDAFEKSVIEKALHDGKVSLPPGLMRMRIVLRWLGRTKFQPSRRYTELQVDDILERSLVGPDTNHARRYMADEKVLARKRDGSAYWRADTPGADDPDFDPDTLPLSDHEVMAEHLFERTVVRTYVRSGRFVVPETNDDGMQEHVLRALWKILQLRFRGVAIPDAPDELGLARSRFDPDQVYTQAYVDAAITKICQGDPARIRGLLVHYKYLTHRKKTNVYLRAGASEAEPADVLGAYIAGERIIRMPEVASELTIVLRWLAGKVALRKRFSEEAIDQIIGRYCDDPAAARTLLVKNSMLDRKNGVYWRAA